MNFKYTPVTFWPNAQHVFIGDTRIGIVKHNDIVLNGKPTRFYEAMTSGMLPVDGRFSSRVAAAQALPKPRAKRTPKQIAQGRV